MKQVIGGDGSDTTNAVKAWLLANNQLRLPTLYLIGEVDDPHALWLTDYESPLLWSFWGEFLNSNIERDDVATKLGLEVTSMNLRWSPPLAPFVNNIDQDSPYRLAWLGYYDQWKVRSWTAYLPTKGDANTFGASELFGGWVGDVQVEAGAIRFKVDSFLSVVNQKVPANVIEILNTLAQFRAATPPPGLTEVPRFSVVAGSTERNIIADCLSPTPGQIFDTNVFQYGYVVFDKGAGQTLGGIVTSIRNSAGTPFVTPTHNDILLLAPLPWSPTPGVDTFYISAAAPVNQADGDYIGFPFVPPPESAI